MVFLYLITNQDKQLNKATLELAIQTKDVQDLDRKNSKMLVDIKNSLKK